MTPDKQQALQKQFVAVDDIKLQMTLSLMADNYNDDVRDIIYRTYNDPEIASIYNGWRNMELFEKGGKSKVYRKVIEFPNFYVYDFCKSIFEPQYGVNWYKERKVWKHELVQPWVVVNKF